MKLFRAIALALIALLFAPVASSAELPSVSKSFPKGWIEIGSKTCTPKQGVEITIKVYRIEHLRMSETVTLTSKNGVVRAQTRMLFNADGSIISGSTMFVTDGRITVLERKNEKDGPVILAKMFKMLDITAEEFESCKKQK